MLFLELSNGNLINPKYIHTMYPNKDNAGNVVSYAVRLENGDIIENVSAQSVNKILQQPSCDKELSSNVSRLIQAIEKLSFRIPSSIRMHL